MDIRVLKYFLAIAQEENVTKAAELLHTTQPNISRQIAELEEELGKQLFVKNGRRFVLTEEGVFLAQAGKGDRGADRANGGGHCRIRQIGKRRRSYRRGGNVCHAGCWRTP